MDVTSKSTWKSVASLLDMRVAHLMAALLEAEAIPAQVISGTKLIDEPLWEISVPLEWFEAARCLLDKSQFTDAELAFLATGVLAGIDDSK
jgi:hypothetical protein